MNRTPKSPMAELRVIKKLAPGVRGTKALTTAYGPELVCVRHRLDTSGTKRLTTVELIVAETIIQRRPGPTVDIALRPHETELISRLRAAGGRWHKEAGVWTLRRSIAVALGLKQRIVVRLP